MMGRRERDQGKLFYDFNLDDVIPKSHLLRRINVIVTVVLAELHAQLKSYYSDIGRPSVDPELMIRMLIVGYCHGIRSERKPARRSRVISPIAGLQDEPGGQGPASSTFSVMRSAKRW